LICLLALLAGCQARPSLLGRWRSAPASAMLFEFREDHSVHLYQDGNDFRVFGYKLIDADTLELYDGMGRLRRLDFAIDGEQLQLYETYPAVRPVEVWTKED
jgi:hypothetical protein